MRRMKEWVKETMCKDILSLNQTLNLCTSMPEKYFPHSYIYVCVRATIFYAPLGFSEKTITLTSILSLGRLFGGISLCSKEL